MTSSLRGRKDDGKPSLPPRSGSFDTPLNQIPIPNEPAPTQKANEPFNVDKLKEELMDKFRKEMEAKLREEMDQENFKKVKKERLEEAEKHKAYDESLMTQDRIAREEEEKERQEHENDSWVWVGCVPGSRTSFEPQN